MITLVRWGGFYNISVCVARSGMALHYAGMQEQQTQITVKVPVPLRAALERAAEADHRTVSSLVRRILAQALERPQ